MIGTDKERFTITVTKTNGAKIKTYSEALGVSKSQFITMALAQYLLALDKSIDALSKLPEIEQKQITLDEVIKAMVDEEE